MMAAEQLNRKCCAIELEPKYCDVIVRRYRELCPRCGDKTYPRRTGNIRLTGAGSLDLIRDL